MSAGARRALPALVIALTLGIGILIGTVVSHGVRAAKGSAGSPDATALPMPTPAEISTSLSQVADKVEDAVVNINTETTVRVARRNPHGQDGSPFDDFFDHFFQGGPGGSSEGDGDYRQQSLGSGVILDKNGYILTNLHVISQFTDDRDEREDGDAKPVDRIKVSLHGDDASLAGRWLRQVDGPGGDQDRPGKVAACCRVGRFRLNARG